MTEELKAYTERKRRQIRQLKMEYGTGVRPSWVSGELAHLEMQLKNAEQEETVSAG